MRSKHREFPLQTLGVFQGVRRTGYGEKEKPEQTGDSVSPVPPEEDPRLTLLFLEAAKAVDQSGTHYKDGSRNEFLYQLAHRCKESGIGKTDMLRLFGKFYSGLEPGEVLSSVDSAYNKQPEAKTRLPKKQYGTDVEGIQNCANSSPRPNRWKRKRKIAMNSLKDKCLTCFPHAPPENFGGGWGSFF